jgi:hypothetical protein
MSLLEKFFAHQKRWNIATHDDAAFEIFLSRLVIQLNRFQDVWSGTFWEEFHGEFNYLNASKKLRTGLPEDLTSLIESSRNSTELANYFQLAFIVIKYLQENNYVDNADGIANFLAEILQDTLDLSPQIPISVSKTNDGIILYPKGADLLDDAVVNQNLLWLESHPNVLKQFEQALTQYMTGDKKQQRNLLDNLRFALEQLLKDILKNDKSLENQKAELLRWLETRGVHKQTINMYSALLFGPYSQFQNDAVKHGKREEEFTENDIEFMIYITGTFMRLLLKLEQNGHIITS